VRSGSGHGWPLRRAVAAVAEAAAESTRGDNDAMDDADTDSAMPLPCDGACGDGGSLCEICVHDRCYGTFRRTIPAVLNRALDVLFVIDNSAGMGAQEAERRLPRP
jgi:hypothetical protein